MTTATHVLTMAAQWDDGRSGHWWFGPLIPLAWITAAALIVLTVWLVTRRRQPQNPTGADRARDLLAQRYAAGELSSEEYRERLDNLS